MSSKRGPGLRRMLVTNALIALVAPLLHLLFTRPLSLPVLSRWLLVSFIHANVIGTVGSVALTSTWASLARLRPVRRWPLTAALLLAAAVGGSLLSVAVVRALGLGSAGGYRDTLLSTLKITVTIAVVCGGGVVLFESTRARLEETNLQLRAREVEGQRAHQLATEARLASLESRIHPHFLFNALNAISALIREDPARAERLVGRLASLLRFSLDSSQRGLVTLGQEMAVVRGYLEIETARFGERLDCSIDLPPSLEALAVPPLSVQTLVENSVKHAVSPRREGGHIHVAARAAHDRLEVAVWDDGPGFDGTTVHSGHGLANLQARLAGLFGGEATLAMALRDGGMAVTLSLPTRPPGAPGT